MGQTIDYDAFRREQEPETTEPPTLKIGGVDYPLAPAIPAVVAIDLLRIEAMEGPDLLLTSDAIETMGRALFGEVWRSILIKHQIALAEVPDIIRLALAAYADVPKAVSPTSPTSESNSPSSTRGRGSKQTSSASTASTS